MEGQSILKKIIDILDILTNTLSDAHECPFAHVTIMKVSAIHHGWFYLILKQITRSINLSKVCGPRSQTWLRFCLTLRRMRWSINLPKACGLRSQAWLRFCLTLRKMRWNINLSKVCGPRSQTWPRFYLIFK